MPRRDARIVCLLAAILSAACSPAAARLARLRILRDQWPRAYFFRAAEGFASNRRVAYEQWDATFSRLMGIEGKCLDEEIPGRSVRNAPFFTRFKTAHPDQLVLLHYNGNARDPRDATPAFFAGHWVYFNGATITRDVPAEEGETDVHVSDPTLFRLNVGRFRDRNEDVGLCLLDERGKPNWHASEQVQLVSVDPKAKTIRVKRGAYGTRPLAFPAGKAYAAAHVHEGPWGQRNHLMWFYNHATRCPRDKQGRACADVLVADLVRHFGPGGKLAAFDGLEFDVLHHTCGGRGRRGTDCDADGVRDGGVFDGVNAYGVGVVEFCRKLRAALGDDRLILADGASHHNQRAVRILNGIESEGWPHLSDWELRDWSGGLNRHAFWDAFGRAPAFSYVNHKFVTRGDAPGRTKRPDVPFNIHRLVFAAALFTNSAVCYAYTPRPEPGERFGVWDELWKGAEHELGWLGKPLGPPVRLATRTPDVLGREAKWHELILVKRPHTGDVVFSFDGRELGVEPTDPKSTTFRFRLVGMPCSGPDLVVAITARGAARKGYPALMPRLAWVGIAAPEGCLARDDWPPRTGMCLRGGREVNLDPTTGATVRWLAKTKLGDDGQVRSGFFVHPPYKGGTGYTFWARDVGVPLGGRLEFHTGMGPKSPERSDGVLFRVLVAELADGKAGPFTPLFEHVQKAWQWTPHQVSLARWGGRGVRLKFVSDCGPKDDATTDHSYWGDVWVLGPGGRKGVTQPVRHMTWLGTEPFTSTFYFPAVRSKAVHIELVVEGREPVWIRSIRAHAHPDAIVRHYERGAVLANPSPRPYTFDLPKLFPGQGFRRLRGSARQDPTTNNGQPAAGTLTLGARDALFLVKTEGE